MKFYVIGLDDREGRPFSGEVAEVVSAHTVFSGGKRHHELVRKRLPEKYTWIDITVPLDAVFSQYGGKSEIVVFASGDPLFFGFANTIRKRLPEAEIVLFPCFNSLQMLAHRLVMPYHDMHIVSLTGRPWHEFDRSLIEGSKKTGILTDRDKTPSSIAQRMLDYGYDNYRMTVGELLGNENEQIRTYTLPEAAGNDFNFPNCLILEQVMPRKRQFGIPEEDFYLLDGRARMITKMPVRLLTLSMLDLHNKQSFWDIGFCTGSVSVEAKLQFPHLLVTAFEQRAEGLELMGNNSRKFGTPGIETVIGDFTNADLSAYPQPDAVFIGGHGGKMREIVALVNRVLLPGGIIVFNSVSAESKMIFEETVEDCGSVITGSYRLTVDDYNTIEVMKAVRRK